MLFCMYSVEIVEFFSQCVQMKIEDFCYHSILREINFAEIRMSKIVILIVLEPLRIWHFMKNKNSELPNFQKMEKLGAMKSEPLISRKI